MDQGYNDNNDSSGQVENEKNKNAPKAKKPKLNENARIDIRMLIPAKHAGSIIGTSGINIKRLRETYEATVLIPNTDGPERVVNITCTYGNVQRIIHDILNSIRAISPDIERVIRILAHKSLASATIGTFGFKIRELREETGAALRIYQECAPFSTDRIIQIGGTIDCIMTCLNSILEYFETIPTIGFTTHYDPSNYDESFASEYGGYTTGNEETFDSGDSKRWGGGGPGPMRVPPRMRGMRARGRAMPYIPSNMNRGMHGGLTGVRGPRFGEERPFARRGMPGFRGSRPSRVAPLYTGFEEEEYNGCQFGEEMPRFQGPRPGRVIPLYTGFGEEDYNECQFGEEMPRFHGHRPSKVMPLLTGFGEEEYNECQFGEELVGNNGFGSYEMTKESGPIETSDFSIPKGCAGAIIGPSGCRIKQIRQATNARITIDEPIKGSTERLVHITGTQTQIDRATEMIKKRFY